MYGLRVLWLIDLLRGSTGWKIAGRKRWVLINGIPLLLYFEFDGSLARYIQNEYLGKLVCIGSPYLYVGAACAPTAGCVPLLSVVVIVLTATNGALRICGIFIFCA